MNSPCLSSRFLSILSLLFLAIGAISPGLSAEVPLRAFSASYDLHKNGMHVAVSELSLQRVAELWRWRMVTRPRGIYAMFVDSEPSSETTFSRSGGDVRLQQIMITDLADKKKIESASFDWHKGNIRVLRKGKRKRLSLNQGVYDYHSIHLLAAAMLARQQNKINLNFYRKGKLYNSSLVYSGKGKISINGKLIEATIFEQVMGKSKARIKYYYDAVNSMLPLRIEKYESGSDSSEVTLTLRQVDWTL